ncbi:MAG: alanine--tRNA ligase [Anaerolineales bacterium]
MLSSAEIRTKFLEFFRERDHTVVKSSSLVPGNDPTLLFTNAGMVQFKNIFLGLEERPYSRATTAQKCMRVSGKHNDLKAVGPSPTHHTFFEMLGNFSFGDYFKKQAIGYAWEFLIKELGLDPERLYPTVYRDDDEAFALWREMANVPPSRITRLGEKENFWAMGDTGPCGPCSEIMYDRGPDACTCGMEPCTPANECERWIEIWNLVFMQFETRDDGTRVSLPSPSIDTGMGFERITAILQGVDSNYDTDLFVPIMAKARELLGHSKQTMDENIVPYRVIADHSRAITFLIGDGVLPNNEGRGYVTRLILRRAARYGRILGFREPFLAETARIVIDMMGEHYTELQRRRQFICDVITQEEERFLSTLSVGLAHLDELAMQLKEDDRDVIPGEKVFRLYDTYGFPLELTRDAAQEMGITVDEAGFEAAMAEQRERARSAQQFDMDAEEELYRRLELPGTEFRGYETCSCESTILALVKDGTPVDNAAEGEEVNVVLDVTPFYAEAGGQVGDEGKLCGKSVHVRIKDAVTPVPNIIVHRAEVVEGTIAVGDKLKAILDEKRRLDIARNHTATHLLHGALRDVLGEHAAQSGSMVAPNRLRFDFSHLSPLTEKERRRVEHIVNTKIRANLPVKIETMDHDQALQEGAIALFGERYGDRVRVVRIGDYSTELCGGTHLDTTGQIGFFLIVNESSVGSGLRRIEAVTGRGAEAYVHNRLEQLQMVGDLLSAKPGEEVARLQNMMEEIRERDRTIEDLRRQLAARSVDALLDKALDVGDARVLSAKVDASNVDTLREMCDRFRQRLGSAVIALGSIIDKSPMIVVAVSDDLVSKGLHAGKLANTAGQHIHGGGGGRPTMAQAGGKDSTKLNGALEAVREQVLEQLER